VINLVLKSSFSRCQHIFLHVIIADQKTADLLSSNRWLLTMMHYLFTSVVCNRQLSRFILFSGIHYIRKKWFALPIPFEQVIYLSF